jgi:hypothetical protein
VLCRVVAISLLGGGDAVDDVDSDQVIDSGSEMLEWVGGE